ncbi:hypothetical protein R1sor_021884 [Riccia sorocarpa]|uniref:Cytochrome P450 n=1 Tax=Riccia sorocarpa TaxID=122646 RepID=A0ABD3GIA7_9MARC
MEAVGFAAADTSSKADAAILLPSFLIGGTALLLFLYITQRQRRKSIHQDPRIPKGSEGWPLIGETFAFGNADPMRFALTRAKKYGSIFRSKILGTPSVIVTTSDAAKFVFGERNIFKASYPSTIATLVGKKSLTSCDPHRHPFLKRIVQGALLPETLRQEVGRIENFVNETLNSWGGKPIDLVKESRTFMLDVAMYFVFGITNLRGTAEAKVLVDMYRAIGKGMYVLPINLPGFTWYKALKAREKGCAYLKTIIEKTREESEKGFKQNTVLGAFVDCKDENGENLLDDEIIDVLIGTLFGAHDTTANALTWMLKHLSEHHDVLETLVAEQEEILKTKEPGQALTWEDYRRMHYTSQVISESLRLPTVLQFIAREPREDVEFKGFLIPRGWRVYVMITCIHLDPSNYPNPLAFDPSRFQAPPKAGTFLPFAAGAHVCPGSELARLVLSVFLHHLCTKFRWQSLQPDMGVQFNPFPSPKGGFSILLERKPNSGVQM